MGRSRAAEGGDRGAAWTISGVGSGRQSRPWGEMMRSPRAGESHDRPSRRPQGSMRVTVPSRSRRRGGVTSKTSPGAAMRSLRRTRLRPARSSKPASGSGVGSPLRSQRRSGSPRGGAGSAARRWREVPQWSATADQAGVGAGGAERRAPGAADQSQKATQSADATAMRMDESEVSMVAKPGANSKPVRAHLRAASGAVRRREAWRWGVPWDVPLSHGGTLGWWDTGTETVCGKEKGRPPREERPFRLAAGQRQSLILTPASLLANTSPSLVELSARCSAMYFAYSGSFSSSERRLSDRPILRSSGMSEITLAVTS